MHPGNRAEGGPDSGDEGRRQGHPLLLSEGTLRLGEVTYVQGWVSCVHCAHKGHSGREKNNWKHSFAFIRINLQCTPS